MDKEDFSMNMKVWLEELKGTHNTMPILTFPAVQHLGVSVEELVKDAHLQVKAMQCINEKCDPLAILGLMDLSIEAENFGSEIYYSPDDIPTVVGSIVNDEEDANNLKVPLVKDGRTQVFVDAVKELVESGVDKPVFPGVIGPFSLAGRLMDVSEAMICCYDDPDMLHVVLEKVTEFLIQYALAFKEAGASGVVMAEPLAGMLSPSLVGEFSCDYVKKFIDAVSDDEFIVVYHNCGDNTLRMVDDLVDMGAPVYHFGNSIDIVKMLEKMPKDVIVMGNVDPVSEFKDGTRESIRNKTLEILEACKEYDNFVISSGCDIPASASWDNIEEYFKTVKNYNKGE